ncbi:MAG: D-alanyl-D-alanine carboxypeptidase (penicillin-binding protein 5/6) [Candidatus Pelagisphaera sp.]|jgi:D-alanyl-D-alanine carboxypeptidase (penicillin-binding protein 5/6)
MYKKLFGIVLVAHLLVLGYLGLRTDDSPKLDENDAFQAEFDSSQHQTGTSPSEDGDDVLVPVKPKLDKPIALEFDASAPNQLPASIRSDDLGTGLLVEIPSGRILWEKDREKLVGIASMTKMMTALIAFEDIRIRDEIDLGTQVQVTDAAYRIGGSQVWLDPREIFSLEELLISVMVKSANDSAYLVGEFLAGGSMSQFIVRMNQRAQELNMASTQFFNAHGLPEKKTDNTSNCEDLVRLANELLQYDQAIEWASMLKYAFRAQADEPTLLANHNTLIKSTIGVDGMKTGYTKRAGFCITATCLRNDRRLIAVTTGFTSSKRRDEFTRDLLDWGYTLP